MSELAKQVEALAVLFAIQPDSAMDRPWAFGAYDSEGVRFAALQTVHELRELAVRIAAQRTPPSIARRIMAQYHVAYRDLQALLLGIPTEDLERAPAEGEWSVRAALEHMMGTALCFDVVIGYALERFHHHDTLPPAMSELEFNRAFEQALAQFGISAQETVEGDFAQVIGTFETLHRQTVARVSAIPDAEMRVRSTWWEGTEMPIRFRLHRFEAHLRQHTIQVEKTLVALGYAATEGRMLVRAMFNALGEVEGASLGADINGEMRTYAADLIETRVAEVAAVFGEGM